MAMHGLMALRWRMVQAAVGAALLTAMPGLAAQEAVTRVSDDPYTGCTGGSPPEAHATEVEPDTFAFGSTVVATFQVGRIFNGGSCNIGWATSHNGGISW